MNIEQLAVRYTETWFFERLQDLDAEYCGFGKTYNFYSTRASIFE